MDFNFSLIPADKNLDPVWAASLFARGGPSVYTGAALKNIGMPVGGICTGQLYLAGDGRLWYWDIFNSPTADMVGGGSGPHYATPFTSALSPVNQGFALKIGSGATAQNFKLDSTGFANVSFLGQYPTGTVNYSDPDCPIQATLEAFSPFIPLNTDDSSIPATIMEFTLTNSGNTTVSVELAGWLQNAVCAFTPGVDGTLKHHATFAADHTRIDATINPGNTAEVVFDDFESPVYYNWTTTGTAFGIGPATLALVTDRGFSGSHGQYVVNSYVAAGDAATGTLTSRTFLLTYNQIKFLICGGNFPGLECFNLCRASDHAVLMSSTGANSGIMTEHVWDVTAWVGQQVYFQVVDNYTGGWGNIGVDYIRLSNASYVPRADIVFDDFERTTYYPWVETGTAFGSGPVDLTNYPSSSYQVITGGHGRYVVNSHASAFGSAGGLSPDTATGMLTSPSFTISRHFIHFLICGGNHPGVECMNLLVNGQIVCTSTGDNSNQMSQACWDVRQWEGQTAQLQIVDNGTGAWGNIGIDYIVFSDTPTNGSLFPANAADYGTMSLSLLSPQAGDRVCLNAPLDTLPDLFAALAANASADVTQALGPPLIAALSRTLTLAPGAKGTVTFVINWHFPSTQNNNSNVNNGGWTGIQNISALQKYYATLFTDAGSVAAYVAANYSRLAGQTRLWRDTWYDSTLPYWFLDRTFANTSTLATNTSNRFSNGRFWGWEGVYCCMGTCTHVWSYAQAVARIFPDIERDTRQNVDFGLAFNAFTGQISNRGEFGDWDVDGQAGTILRAYREHQMSADNTFLATNWPNIKKAMQFLLVNYDPNSDGIIEGPQPNTLDATWYGKISWLSGYYVAACAACQQMALEMGDVAFAAQLGSLWQSGANYIRDNLFYHNEYFIQLPDSSGNNVGAAYGCEIDQVLGQSWAFQVGLGQILDPTRTLSALARIWKYNAAPDAGGFRLNPANPVSGGRDFADPGEAGLVMCTFPDPANDLPLGLGGTVGYFNECMTGFEHEVASHMIWQGMLLEGLAITRAIHDRYNPSKRNPYNEVECSDHYARAMASYGSFIAACGYEYHGPKCYLAFSPKLTPENFKAAFTVAEGWGSFAQQRAINQQNHTISVCYGQLQLQIIAFDLAPGMQASNLNVMLDGNLVSAIMDQSGSRVTLTLAPPQTIAAGQSLTVQVVSVPLLILSEVIGNGGSQLTWQSVPGKSYSVQYTGNLLSPWQTLTSGVPASSGATTSFLDTANPSQSQRFYRIQME